MNHPAGAADGFTCGDNAMLRRKFHLLVILSLLGGATLAGCAPAPIDLDAHWTNLYGQGGYGGGRDRINPERL